jgi:mRNA interferase MazF
MKIRKFNIYLADLSPRFGTEPGKTRPVVVLQTNLLNDGLHPSTIVCPITTNVIHEADILRVHLSPKAIGLKKIPIFWSIKSGPLITAGSSSFWGS